MPHDLGHGLCFRELEVGCGTGCVQREGNKASSLYGTSVKNLGTYFKTTPSYMAHGLAGPGLEEEIRQLVVFKY